MQVADSSVALDVGFVGERRQQAPRFEEDAREAHVYGAAHGRAPTGGHVIQLELEADAAAAELVKQETEGERALVHGAECKVLHRYLR